ncbi:glucosaminidase domain-containing protein [Paraburkholderia sp. BR10936]|uniref:glucosaminidase domain-containing protein n=1 Tax=Paraburkholderia sp. BR10936 TaxID=3236993 RepID=UPI0034D233C0
MADTGITWGAPADDTSTDSGISWGGSSNQAPQTDFSPNGFASYYQDAIQNAATKLGVPASAIAGQWGLETGWGKSVIPGTNNLGNVKSTANSGQGVRATDNTTGGTDSYQQFVNPLDFSNAYVNLIKSSYPKAVGAQNPTAFATALKQGGYAQDPKYVGKVSAAANLANTALTALTGSTNANASEAPPQSGDDFNQWLQSNSKGASPATASVSSGGNDFDSWMKNNGQMGTGSIAENIWNGIKNIPSNVANGVSQSFQHPLDFAKGAASSVWNPLINAFAGQTVAEASQAPNSTVNVTPQTIAAQKAVSQQHNITPGTNTNQSAYNAGHFVGDTAVSAGAGVLAPEFAGASLLGRVGAAVGNGALQGAIQGGVPSTLDGDSLAQIAQNTALGAAGGAALGPVAHAVGAVAKPVISKVLGTKAAIDAVDATASNAGTATGGAFSPAEKDMAGKIAQAVDADSSPQTAQDVATQLSSSANSAVPGYQRTAAEATDNPTIQAIQQGLDKSDNNAGLAARANTNADANTSFLRQGATSDADLQAQRDAFQQSQDALAAQGNAQMPAVSATDNNGLFNTPAMQRTLGRANVLAQNEGDPIIQRAFDAPNDNLVNRWNNIAGSPQKTANLELERQFRTSPMYQDVLDAAAPIAVDDHLAGLLNTPAMQRALRAVETFKNNAQDETPFIQDVAALGSDGRTYAQSINPQDLNLAKMHLDDYMQRMGNPSDIASADKFELTNYARIRAQVNNLLEGQVPGFADVNKQYAKLSDQMAESKFLTSPNMVDAFGKLNVRQLDSLVKSLEAGKANNNEFDPAKAVSNAKLAQLTKMRDDAVAMMGRNNARGLRGDAYSYMRQAAEKDPVAAQALQQHLEANAPAYKQFYADQQAGQDAIARQENYNELVKKFDTRTDGNVSWHDVKNLGNSADEFDPINVARLNAVRDNLQRYATRTERVAGSDTASNFGKREGFENLVAGERGNGIGNALMSEAGERAVRTGLGSVATGLGFSHFGPLGGIAADYLMDKAGTKAATALGKAFGGDTADAIAAKTAANRDAVENLLLNPKRLSDAISAVDTANKAKAKLAENLISKVKGVQNAGGLLGAVAAGQVAASSNKKQGK